MSEQEAYFDPTAELDVPTPEPFGRYEWFFLDTNAPGCQDYADRILLRVTHESDTHIRGEAVYSNGIPIRPARLHRIDKRVIDSRGHWHPSSP